MSHEILVFAAHASPQGSDEQIPDSQEHLEVDESSD